MPPDQLAPRPFPLPSSPTAYTFYLLTARYGGGVSPGLPDDFTPFRVPEIRGALRFWWRATRGSAFSNSTALFEEEARIWGSTDRKSAVNISIAQFTSADPVDAKDKQPAYALFPAQQDRKNPGKLSEGGAFTLAASTTAPEISPELEAALWAWTNFGGYGARTRRGAGTLFSPNFCFTKSQSNHKSAVLDWLREQAGKHMIADRTPRPWPTLSGSVAILGERPSSPNLAWQECIRIYKDFRQNRSGSGGRGRSRWPEPDSIRLKRRTNNSRHPPIQQTGDFPRAIFGMPIVFHFKDPGEPGDQSLEPQSDDPDVGGRLASPILLKPLAVSQNLAYPMVVRLNSNLFSRGSDAYRAIADLVLKQTKPRGPDDIPVSLGPRRADEEFLQRVETAWSAKRVVL